MTFLRFFPRWTLAAVLMAICLGQASSRHSPAANAALIADLLRWTGGHRLVEARLSGGLPYAPWSAERAAGTRVSSRWAGVRALATAASNRHETGRIHLLLGAPDDAVRVLSDVVDSEPAPGADLLNDLAAAQLERAKRTGDAFEAARALESIERALAIDPHHREALFNRSLAFEALRFELAAQQSWAVYASHGPRSPWEIEARARSTRQPDVAPRRPTPEARQRLAGAVAAGDWGAVQELVTSMPQIGREHLDDDLLPAWAEAQLAGDRRGASDLSGQARHLAALLFTRHSERSWRDLCERLAGDDPARLADTARALQALRQVRQLIDQNRFEEAWPPLEQAQALTASEPPLAAAADLWRHYIEWHRGRRALVIAESDSLFQRCQQLGFKYLGARILLLRASTLESLTRFSDAYVAYRESTRLFAEIGEYEYAASSHASLSTSLAMQGELHLAWTELRRALELLRDMDSPRRRFMVLTHAVVLPARFGLPYAARPLQNLLIDETRRFGDDGALIRQLIERARLYLDSGDVTGARHAMQDAEQAFTRLKDPSYRAFYEQDLRVEQARVIAVDDPGRGARMLGSAIERLSQTGRILRVAELHLMRGRALSRAGDDGAALDEWLLGIQRFEDERAEVRDQQLRISHFSRAWELYDEAIRMLVRRGDSDRALVLVERARARALLDSLRPGQRSARPSGAEVVASLPPKLLTLVYHSLPDGLLVWALDASRVSFEVVPISSRRVTYLASRARGDADDLPSVEALTELSRVMLGPVTGRLGEARRLVIVPDPIIAGVPFGALPVPRSQAPLVEVMPLTLAPSLSLLDIASRSMRASLSRSNLKASFFGDPAPGPGASLLPRLPEALREISASASVYAGAQTFSGGEATRSRFLRALDNGDVLHFAGHAVANAEFPGQSRLVLSPESKGTGGGDLLAGEIAGRWSVRTRLVVLSACSTAMGPAAFGEGVLSLARPFLAAGVPQVIATLWDIDDRAGRELIPRFHAWYGQGVDAAEALRRAQMELRTSPDPLFQDPRIWAAFVVVGGVDGLSDRH